MRYLLSTCKTTRGGRPDVKVNRITAHVFALRWAVRTQCDDCCFNARFWLSMRNFMRGVRKKRRATTDEMTSQMMMGWMHTGHRNTCMHSI